MKKDINGHKTNYHDYIIKQYEIYVQSAEKISDRRYEVNKYFYTLNSGLFVITGFIIRSEINPEYILLTVLLISLLGIALSIIFWALINSYKQMNSAKFKVIHNVELELPVQPYKDEWNYLNEGKYLPFSNLEMKIPAIFGFIYTITFITALTLLLTLLCKKL